MITGERCSEAVLRAGKSTRPQTSLHGFSMSSMRDRCQTCAIRQLVVNMKIISFHFKFDRYSISHNIGHNHFVAELSYQAHTVEW